MTNVKPEPTTRIARSAAAEQNVCVFVFNGIADWEIGHATAHINASDYQKQPGRYRVLTCGVNLDPVRTQGGLNVVPDARLEDVAVPRTAMLILPGGKAWHTTQLGAALETARAVLDLGGSVAAICGATYALAQVGLLDDRAHTSNAAEYIAQSGYAGAAHYQASAVVVDRGVITAGSTAVVDFAAAIFKQLELYESATLEAWTGLFRTGEARYFFELMAASAQTLPTADAH